MRAPTRLRVLSTAVLASAAVAAAPSAADARTLIGTGSSVAEPYMRALFAGYHKVKPSIKFVYTADGGNAGVKDVQQRRAQFAVNTRPPLPSDSGTTYRQLFLDGLCIDVNTANHLTNINISPLADLFLARVTNWSDVPGSGLSSTVAPIGRDATAGTYTFFQSAVLNGKTQASNVNAVASDGLVANAVAKDPNAIGYVGFAHSKGSHLKTLTLNGVACAPKNVRSQRYPLSRYIWFVTPSDNPSVPAVRFAQWVRTSAAAGRILKRAGAVPAFNRSR
jgi:phosphate transport system substrate-binding protein